MCEIGEKGSGWDRGRRGRREEEEGGEADGIMEAISLNN